MTGLGSAHRDDGEHDDRACSERVMSGRGAVAEQDTIRAFIGARVLDPDWVILKKEALAALDRLADAARPPQHRTDDDLVRLIAAAERELRRRKDTT